MSDTETKPLSTLDLAQFTGTTQWYQHSLIKNVTYTDGVKYLAKKARAYWLIDEIAFTGTALRLSVLFQVWILNVANGKGRLRCEDGNKHIAYKKYIPYTDFPLAMITLYYQNDVIFLPSEY